MERWWGSATIARALEALYGSLDARPLQATLERGKAHEQAVALATLGAAQSTTRRPPSRGSSSTRSRSCATTPARALEALRGQACAVDSRPADVRDRGRRARLRPGAFAAGALPAGAPPVRERDVPDEDRAARATIARRVRRRRRQTAARFLLTGFLGAGKTTILNRVLGASTGGGSA